MTNIIGATASSHLPAELSFSLPKTGGQTKIHIRLTVSSHAILLFLNTVESGETSQKPALGSFVYAMPDRLNKGQTLCSNIFIYDPTIDFTTRTARLLARKTQKPVYVGNSMSFASTGMGGTVAEEMEAFKKVLDVVTVELERSDSSA